MMPKKPLQPLSTYRARMAVKTPSGREVTRSWQFTTGKAAPIAPAPKPMPKPSPKATPKTPKPTKKKKCP